MIDPTMHSKIIVTGATGFVGRQLVPILRERGAELLLVGRDTGAIRALFPDVPCCDYDHLAGVGAGCDVLVHLATMNNNAAGDLAAFTTVNVGLTVRVAEIARDLGIRRFIDVSSILALDLGNDHPYAVTKRLGTEALAKVSGLAVETVHLAVVHGRELPRKVAVLEKLPGPIARLAFSAIAALVPTTDVALLADRITGGAGEAEVVLTDGQAKNVVFQVVKRALDLCAAVAILVLLWWALLLVWVVIRYDSKGPGVFAQKRVGRNGAIFTCYKFRTMKQDTPTTATHHASTSSITGVGAFLRRTKLDELPQVFNILRGEISLVGPRPCLPIQAELIEARRRAGVFASTPGISGLAQINGIDMSDPALLAQWDGRYLALQSLLLDLRIILATATGKGSGDKVRHA